MNSLAPVLVIALAFLPSHAIADEADIVFKYDVDESAAAKVTDTNSLVQFLRDDVRISAAISVDSTLWVDVRGYAGDPAFRSPEVFHTPDLRIALNKGQSISEITWSDAVIESHGSNTPDDGDVWHEQQVNNWTESNAWGRLLWILEESLPEYTDRFGPPNSQFQGLRVTGVDVRTFEFSEQDTDPGAEFAQFGFVGDEINGPVILLKPDLIWDDTTYSLRDELSVETDVLVIHIEPTAPQSPPVMSEAQKIAQSFVKEICPLLSPGGEAQISLGEETLTGNATAITGPRGEFLVVLGQRDGSESDWCMMVGSSAPVESDGTYELVDPETFVAGRGSMTSAFEQNGALPQTFWVTAGQVELADSEGRLSMNGELIKGAEDAVSIELSGWFRAEMSN